MQTLNHAAFTTQPNMSKHSGAPQVTQCQRDCSMQPSSSSYEPKATQAYNTITGLSA